MDSDLARRRALEAERLSASEPHRARELAGQAREFARREHDDLTELIAQRAIGLACRELNDLPRARRHLRRAIDIAERAGLASEAATTRGRLAYVISLQGDTSSALAGFTDTSQATERITRAQLQMQEALVLQRTGRSDEALELYRRSIPHLQRSGSFLDEARARTNRSVLYTYRGNYSAAEGDLRRAEELAPLVGEGVATAKIHHNLGFVAACRGNIPEALAWFDKAQEEFASLGQSETPVLADRCEVLLSVGLADEGLLAAQRAVAELEQHGSALELAEARLMAARAALATGELTTATRSAKKARSEFHRQSRPGWEVLADYVISRAGIARKVRLDAAQIAPIADKLSDSGWLLASLELRLSWAMENLDGSLSQDAHSQLRIVAQCRTKTPALIRGHGWHAEALLRNAVGDESGCRAALRTGLRALEQYHAALGATELQVHAASNAKELAALGCRLALDSGKPTDVLEWSERWKAGALRNRPLRAPKDREVERLLGELRHVTAEMEVAALEGRNTSLHLQRLAGLETQIRDSSRRTPGGVARRVATTPKTAELRQELGNRSLVEYLAIDGRLFAVTVTPRRTKLFRLCTVAEVINEADSLRFSYARLARGRGSPSSIDTFAAAAVHASGSLETLLFGAMKSELGNGPIVVIPTGRLHHLPWAGLQTCRDRTVSVAPSAAAWIDANRRPRGRHSGRVVLVAGPGLPHAETEVLNLRAIYPQAIVLTGPDATTERVANALDGARLAHVAAHGSFRSDNPLFSSLQLFDGRLTVYDLDRLRKAPELLILSACESGLNAVRPGDELLGLSAAVLSLGTKNLMASVVPVPDLTTASFMVKVHQHLSDKKAPPDGAAMARDDSQSLSQAEMVTTAGFVCFGA